MEMPQHIWRCPTREAIDKLAIRFGLPNFSWMQDWEYQVSDHTRIDEFLTAYETEALSDDEKFTLMETVIDSFEQLAGTGCDIAADLRWQRTISALDKNISLHAYSVWYWCRLDAEHEDEVFRVTPFVRQVFARHKDYFFGPGS
jgi:hypothetical protein